MRLDIKSSIICDLVRIENTGKHILIGVYTGSIIFARLPARFAPTVWFEIVPFVQDAEMHFELKVEAPGLQKPRITSVSMPVERQEKALIITPIIPIEITEPGRFTLSMRPKGGRWKEVLSKDVELAGSALPTG